MSQLRVMTYNVRSLRDDVEVAGAVIRAGRPDVLLVQEAPRFLRWRSKRAALARRGGLVVATTDRVGGLCIMTSLAVDVVSTSFALLPKTSGRHQRAVAGAVVRCRGETWRVLDTHLSTDGAERSRHLPALHAALTADPAHRVVLGGDINEEPGGPVFTDLAGRLSDCFAVIGADVGSGTAGATSPAAAPRRRIDAIFADPAVRVVSCGVVAVDGVARASDHRPVLAVLET